MKKITVLYGNTESRVVYKNFELDNLDQNSMDRSHHIYEHYLQYNKFVPPGEKNYFVHTMNNMLPDPPSKTTEKGLFNCFPVDLTDVFKSSTTNIGVIKSSPLKIELAFSPIPTIQWYLMYTFVYLNVISFSGSKDNQVVRYEHLM